MLTLSLGIKLQNVKRQAGFPPLHHPKVNPVLTMNNAFSSGLQRYWRTARQWFFATPERALDEAYGAALKIKQIEDQHFGGDKISANHGYGEAVSAYFQSELQKSLNIARMRLMEFKISNRMVRRSEASAAPGQLVTRIQRNGDYATEYTLASDQYTIEVEAGERSPSVLEKLKFVDQVLARYKSEAVVQSQPSRQPAPARSEPSPEPTDLELRTPQETEVVTDELGYPGPPRFQQGSFIPRSILRTVNRFKKELDPGAETEEEVVRDFRTSRLRTRIAIRFVLLLIIVPLLTQQLSKALIFGPLIDYLGTEREIPVTEIVVSSPRIQAKVLAQLEEFREQLTFDQLIGNIPDLSPSELTAQLRQKALQLSQEYYWEGREPLKNILADSLSLVAFAILIATGKQELAILKSFIDEVAYDLSDSAKAFIIILLTDVFVGFHSPHGWDVIIRKSLEHFGLPDNEDFVNMFIATFPVMLDAVFKYWIFRYLNQISPSAVATYRNMNE